MTVQSGNDLYSVGWKDCTIAKYSSILTHIAVKKEILATLERPCYDSAIVLYQDRLIYIISGYNGEGSCDENVFCFDIRSNECL